MDERITLLRQFGLHNFPADTTPAECTELFDAWLSDHYPSFPSITAKAIGPLLVGLGFRRIGWKHGRVRLFNPHFGEVVI